MPLVHAAALGIDRFRNERHKENWRHATESDRSQILRSIYQQVLGHQYVMENERPTGLESLFRHGDLSVREFVRSLAKSALYRSRFFVNCTPYRFIELNHKHLLGRAPHNREEMLRHFTILQNDGYDAEIDSYIDSVEYQERFGEDVVPFLHGWDYSAGHEGRQFSWLMQLARGAAASAKGDGAPTHLRFGRALHQNQPVPVAGGVGRVLIVSTEGPFRARISEATDLPENSPAGPPRHSHAGEQRQEPLGRGTGERSTDAGSRRLATITATGVVDNRYSRSGITTIRVPVSRMNEALQRCNRLGARVIRVAVNNAETA